MPDVNFLSHVSFGAATVLTGYLVHRCLTPPVPPRFDQNRQIHDTLKTAAVFSVVSLYRNVFLGISVCQGIYCLALSVLSSTTRARFEVNQTLSDWSVTTVTLFPVIWVGVYIRLSAVNALGKNFTFDLREPDKLKTDGVYAYVQHPSYTGGVLFVVGSASWLVRSDGFLSLVLPRWIMDAQWLWNVLLPVTTTAVVAVGAALRVRDEESMLKKKFGKEWDVWHKNTPRFVPFVI